MSSGYWQLSRLNCYPVARCRWQKCSIDIGIILTFYYFRLHGSSERLFFQSGMAPAFTANNTLTVSFMSFVWNYYERDTLLAGYYNHRFLSTRLATMSQVKQRFLRVFRPCCIKLRQRAPACSIVCNMLPQHAGNTRTKRCSNCNATLCETSWKKMFPVSVCLKPVKRAIISAILGN